MPWVNKRTRQHECILQETLPDPRAAYDSGAGLGSVYKCDLDDCDRQWVLSDSQMDGLYWREKNTP